jgi:tripartite-type tricarboxylate transporter receptor subunit TctC
MQVSWRIAGFAAAFAVASVTASIATQAQSYPNRAVKLIVPASPGGVLDVTARVVGQRLAEQTGQQFVVENRPGGGGVIGVMAVKGVEADGYTLLVAHSGEMAINPSLIPNLQYDPAKDFIPIHAGMRTPLMWAASAKASLPNIKEMVERAKKDPGGLAWASAGNGTLNHIIGEMFAVSMGLKLNHVAYRGGGPAATAVAGGEVPVGMLAVSSAAPHIKAGRVIPLAVTSLARAKMEPDWPTVSETVLKGFDASIWTGFFAPTGTPAAVIERLEREIATSLTNADLIGRFTGVGAEPFSLGRAEFAKLVKDDAEKFGRFIKEHGIKGD